MKDSQLPTDIIMDILQRLPTKTLAKFCCVCTSWLTLISDPAFRKRHLRRCLKNPALLSCSTLEDDDDGGRYNVTITLSYFDTQGTHLTSFVKEGIPKGAKVVSTCLDWALLEDSLMNLYLCKCATQELVTLPKISNDGYRRVGFGYVPSTMEFKVVVHKGNVGFKVFTLGDHRWREMDHPSQDVIVQYTSAPFVNGAIHLRSCHDRTAIVYFNLEREEWGVLTAPEPSLNSHLGELRELRGYLCIMEWWNSSEHSSIWLLKDYDKGVWIKEHNIWTYALEALGPKMLSFLALEDYGIVLFQVDGCSLQLYDPRTESFREIHLFQEIHATTSFYVRSFLPLKKRMRKLMESLLATIKREGKEKKIREAKVEDSEYYLTVDGGIKNEIIRMAESDTIGITGDLKNLVGI